MTTVTLHKIADNLTNEQHLEIVKMLHTEKIDGIELSHFGGAYGSTWNDNEKYDLGFLSLYKGIKAIRVFLPLTQDLSYLHPLKDNLEWLSLGELSDKKVSLKPLAELTNLKSLDLVRNDKDIEILENLTNLEELSLTGYKVDKLFFFKSLQNLKRLYIGFGTSKSLDTLKSLKNLEQLNILWVKQLADVTAISDLVNLTNLKIEDEKQIKELPPLENLKKLKHIMLSNLGGLENIDSLTDSYVEEFALSGPLKNADIIKPVAASKFIQRAYTYFYTKKEQAKSQLIIGQKFVEYDKLQFGLDTRANIKYCSLQGFGVIGADE
ncbi:leucine-rich repeat domain-containing protein [Ferruginibacter profundus]